MLTAYLKARQLEFSQISEARIAVLERLAAYIRKQKEAAIPVSLNFICTHNSRRSHLSQIAAATALAYYGIGEVRTFSGGTETTAFHPNAVATLRRAGFQILNPGGINPVYKVRFSSSVEEMECFSKVFDHPINPKRDFAAIMTCSDADAHCPFLSGASFRLSLTYEDPKVSDGTSGESEVYDARLRQISRELLFACSKV